MKTSTIALILSYPPPALSGDPSLVETLSDHYEIELMESYLKAGEKNPLQHIYEYRSRESRRDEEFGNYVEDLLCRPFLNHELQNHAVHWLKSKIKIEEYQKIECQAAQTIADFAYQIYQKDPTKTDFCLAGENRQVRIRIFIVNGESVLHSTGGSM